MPQQNNLLLDFNPTAQGGPFAEQLSNPYQSQREASGWSGKAGDSFMLASKFLEGMQEGKLAKYRREESQIAKRRTVLGDYIQQKMNDPDVPDAAKREIGKIWTNWMTQTIATSGEDKGQGRQKPEGIKGHLVSFIKDFAKAQLGGNIPKHKDIDKPENVIFAIEQNLRDKPEWRSNTKAAEEAIQQIQQKVQGLGQSPSQQDVLKAVGPDLDRLQVLAPDRYNAIRQNLLGGYQDIQSGERDQFKLQDPNDPTKFIPAERDKRNPNVYLDHMGQPLGPEYNNWIPVPSQFRATDPTGPLQTVADPSSSTGGRLATRSEARGKEAMPTGVAAVLDPATGKPVEQPAAKRIGLAPVPPQQRTAQNQQHAIARFEKIEDKKTTALAKAEAWAAQARLAVRNKSAAAAAKLGLPASGANWKDLDAFIVDNLNKKKQQAQDDYMQEVGQANQLYYGGTEPPPESREQGAAAASETGPPETSDAVKPWTADDVSKMRRKR